MQLTQLLKYDISRVYCFITKACFEIKCKNGYEKKYKMQDKSTKINRRQKIVNYIKITNGRY